MYVCIHEFIRLIMMKIRMKIKNGSYRYDLGVDMDTNIVKKKVLLLYIKQHLSNMWSSFMKKLSNTEAELKKVVYTLSPISDVNVEESCFFLCRITINL